MTQPLPFDPSPSAGSERTVALAGLLRVAEPPSAALTQFVDKVGAIAAWQAVITRRAPLAVLAATAARSGAIGPEVLIGRAHEDLAAAASVGAVLIGPDDPGWPAEAVESFRGAVARGSRGAAPPIALYLRGTGLVGLPGRGVTIVGSRACSPYGQRVASEMAHELAARGLTVVSGAAFGIDTAAHRGALAAVRSVVPQHHPDRWTDRTAQRHAVAAGGSGTNDEPCHLGQLSPPVTVAVLACGIDRAYPEANRPLLQLIAASGSVVSEYPPGATPARHRFLVRNRLIAAFGAATVVVEAGRRSGTLSTAAAAEQLGRQVMAVPGPVTSAMSVGCHLLLADRFAQLVTGAGDVLAAIGRVAPTSDVSAAAAPGEDPLHPTDGLDESTARVYDSFPAQRWCSVDDLVNESGLPPSQVIGSLAVLEMHALATRDGPRWRRSPRSAGSKGG